jgi:gas vesicle protein
MEQKKSILGSFLKGLLVGGITASIVSLLTAPHSGVETRRMLRDKGEQARDKTVQAIENTRVQVNNIVSNTRQRADQMVKRIEGIEGQLTHPMPRESD